MFEMIKYRWRIRKLFKSQAKTKRFYEKLRKKADKDGKSNLEIQSLWEEEGFEVQQIDEEIKVLVTTQLCNTAHRLLVPIPDLKNEAMWIKLDMLARKALTPNGISELRSAIRKERQERLANLSFWITILFGLIGLITGLIAVMKK